MGTITLPISVMLPLVTLARSGVELQTTNEGSHEDP